MKFGTVFRLSILLGTLTVALACDDCSGGELMMGFDPSQAQDLESPDGAKVSLEANALVTEAGDTPTGMVTAKLQAPLSAESTPADMPGGFGALDSTGAEVTLVSYGFIEASFVDEAGNTLDLREGVTAEISIPAIATGPNSIPLWWLDESAGVWREEGTATLRNQAYVGAVAHFTLWNVDGRCDQACIRGRVVDSVDGTPISDVTVSTVLKSTNCEQWRTGALNGGSSNSGSDGRFTVNKLVRSSKYDVQVGDSVTPTEVDVPNSATDCVDLGDVSVSAASPTPDAGITRDAGANAASYFGIVWQACSNATDYKDGVTKRASPSSVVCETVEESLGWIMKENGELVRPGWGSGSGCDKIQMSAQGNGLFQSSCGGSYQHTLQGEFLRIEINDPQAVGNETVYIHLRRAPNETNPCTAENTESKACPTF